MLKFLTLAMNFGVLVVFAFMFADHGMPRQGELPLIGLVLLASILSIAFALKHPSTAKDKVGSLAELASLEIEARKATLKRRIECPQQD